MNPIKEIFEHVRLIIAAAFAILILGAFGTAFSKIPGGALSVQVTNLGIDTITVIVGGAGIVGFIVLVIWILKSLRLKNSGW